jgi:hypothetical protein
MQGNTPPLKGAGGMFQGMKKNIEQGLTIFDLRRKKKSINRKEHKEGAKDTKIKLHRLCLP